jgi:hypothetical protein
VLGVKSAGSCDRRGAGATRCGRGNEATLLPCDAVDDDSRVVTVTFADGAPSSSYDLVDGAAGFAERRRRHLVVPAVYVGQVVWRTVTPRQRGPSADSVSSRQRLLGD